MPNQSKSNPKSQTSRANGAKSRGPVTPEGRAKSSRNSTRHGLRAKSVVLPTESAAEFQSLLDSYTDQFHPQTGLETELVEVMAVARWRLRRLCNIETSLLTNGMLRNASQIEKDFDEMDCDLDDDDRLAWVFKRHAELGQTLQLLVRYEGTLSRAHDRAFNQLQLLQSVYNRPRPNEPSSHPAKLDPPKTFPSETSPPQPSPDSPAATTPAQNTLARRLSRTNAILSSGDMNDQLVL